eukprot:CAMPEP_0171317882 /NCGR_PEP_ID=MMETSP0816-20121228/83846_1 /TAXON_ID=420281 /ORGANISM="Proboscia inermis, Strain CCAP1064/1" /LENGTH=117 /DNA_ID=CAMNT_0011811637 /DNA_START=501 /DNA_END=854 /DNA_ORIENTATION=+
MPWMSKYRILARPGMRNDDLSEGTTIDGSENNKGRKKSIFGSFLKETLKRNNNDISEAEMEFIDMKGTNSEREVSKSFESHKTSEMTALVRENASLRQKLKMMETTCFSSATALQRE